MTIRMPSLNALRMFEAAARHGNFTRAAESLFVTQGAVSRQIKRLEEDLGQPLFRRDGPRIELTATGIRLYDSAQEAFGILRHSTTEIRRQSVSSALTISVLPSFASKWLIPRLISFQRENAKIDVRLSASYDVVDFTRQPDIDLAIRFGGGTQQGLYRECVISERLFPVCSPAYRRQASNLTRAKDISKQTLLYATEPYDQWEDWFHAVGASPPKHPRGPRYSDALMLQKAAVEGQGIALVRNVIAEEDVSAGRLVRLFATSIPSNYNIYFVCPEGRENEPNIRKFLHWFRRQALETDSACGDLVDTL